jgi:8-oxo-dGTP diphosphatase
MTLRVVAALIARDDELLVCQRSKDGPVPLKWEFPGGKIEPDETELEALRRELREELGIEVEAANLFFRHTHRYPDWSEVDLAFFRVTAFEGAIQNLAFEQLEWTTVKDLGRHDFLEGDRPLIDKLACGEMEL